MKVRVPVQSVIVVRDGKSVSPPLGAPFEFEDAEVADIERMNPAALSVEATVDVSATDAKTEGKAAKGNKAAPTGNEGL